MDGPGHQDSTASDRTAQNIIGNHLQWSIWVRGRKAKQYGAPPAACGSHWDLRNTMLPRTPLCKLEGGGVLCVVWEVTRVKLWDSYAEDTYSVVCPCITGCSGLLTLYTVSRIDLLQDDQVSTCVLLSKKKLTFRPVHRQEIRNTGEYKVRFTGPDSKNYKYFKRHNLTRQLGTNWQILSGNGLVKYLQDWWEWVEWAS